MSKITKNDLKFIVKECLIEILSEGLSGKTAGLTESRKKSNYTKRKDKQNKKSTSYLDNIVYGSNKKQAKSTSNIRTNISDNSILNEMFADTAQNTLQEQIAADNHKSRNHSMPGPNADNPTKIVANHAPEELFGDAASKWSRLAFFDAQ